jgi:hypothetical protein
MPTDPSPQLQATVYMAGILLGYALLTPRQDWERVWQSVRTMWERDPR